MSKYKIKVKDILEYLIYFFPISYILGNGIINFNLFLIFVFSLIFIFYYKKRIKFNPLLIATLILGSTNYQLIQNFFNSFIGKFIIIGIVWSFSFQILCEIRHLFWDIGYGFDLKVSKITGLLVIISSFLLTILIFVIGRHII